MRSRRCKDYINNFAHLLMMSSRKTNCGIALHRAILTPYAASGSPIAISCGTDSDNDSDGDNDGDNDGDGFIFEHGLDGYADAVS